MTPSKIVCIGRNYVEHAKELGHDVPTEPLFFLKPPSSLIASGEPIILPAQSSDVQFEGEIGLLIGTRLHNATEAVAAKAITGVFAANDVTARDLQRKDSQWTRAKGFDTFCPIGPTSPPPADFGALTLVTRVNGVERQRGTTAEMLFSIPAVTAYVSQFMTLEAGDIILTGTPAGVGTVRAGDDVEVEVVGLSIVRNPVRSPA